MRRHSMGPVHTCQVLDRALAGDDGLHEEAEVGEHGEAAILDLLHLELCRCVGVVSQAEGVECLACKRSARLVPAW